MYCTLGQSSLLSGEFYHHVHIMQRWAQKTKEAQFLFALHFSFFFQIHGGLSPGNNGVFNAQAEATNGNGNYAYSSLQGFTSGGAHTTRRPQPPPSGHLSWPTSPRYAQTGASENGPYSSVRQPTSSYPTGNNQRASLGNQMAINRGIDLGQTRGSQGNGRLSMEKSNKMPPNSGSYLGPYKVVPRQEQKSWNGTRYYEAGELIPGARGFRVPKGFRAKVWFQNQTSYFNWPSVSNGRSQTPKGRFNFRQEQMQTFSQPFPQNTRSYESSRPSNIQAPEIGIGSNGNRGFTSNNHYNNRHGYTSRVSNSRSNSGSSSDQGQQIPVSTGTTQTPHYHPTPTVPNSYSRSESRGYSYGNSARSSTGQGQFSGHSGSRQATTQRPSPSVGHSTGSSSSGGSIYHSSYPSYQTTAAPSVPTTTPKATEEYSEYEYNGEELDYEYEEHYFDYSENYEEEDETYYKYDQGTLTRIESNQGSESQPPTTTESSVSSSHGASSSSQHGSASYSGSPYQTRTQYSSSHQSRQPYPQTQQQAGGSNYFSRTHQGGSQQGSHRTGPISNTQFYNQGPGYNSSPSSGSSQSFSSSWEGKMGQAESPVPVSSYNYTYHNHSSWPSSEASTQNPSLYVGSVPESSTEAPGGYQSNSYSGSSSKESYPGSSTLHSQSNSFNSHQSTSGQKNSFPQSSQSTYSYRRSYSQSHHSPSLYVGANGASVKPKSNTIPCQYCNIKISAKTLEIPEPSETHSSGFGSYEGHSKSFSGTESNSNGSPYLVPSPCGHYIFKCEFVYKPELQQRSQLCRPVPGPCNSKT